VSRFVCTFNDCDTSYNLLKNLLAHLQKVHKLQHKLSENENVQVNDQCNVIENRLDHIPEQLEIEEEQECQHEELPAESEISVKKIEDEIDDVLFAFLNSFHSKSSMTKKMINEIFTSTKKNLIDKILDAFKVSENDKSILSKSFLKMNTQYKYEKVLKSKGMLTNGKKYDLFYFY
jgi:hypothetical protein